MKNNSTIKLDKYGNEITKVNVLTQSYKSYRFKNDKYDVKLTELQYKSIIQMFIEKMFECIVKEGYKFHLPYNLGSFEIIQINQLDLAHYFKMKREVLKNNNIRYYLTDRNKGDAMQILNKKTNGCWWKFKWFKRLNKRVVKNLRKYVVKLVRSNVRSSSNKDYSKLTSRLNVTDYYVQEGYKKYREIDVKWFKHYRTIKEQYDNLTKQS